MLFFIPKCGGNLFHQMYFSCTLLYYVPCFYFVIRFCYKSSAWIISYTRGHQKVMLPSFISYYWQVEHVKISQCHYRIGRGIVIFQCSLHLCLQEHIFLPNKSCPPSSASNGAVPHHWHNGILAGFFSKDQTGAHLLVLGWKWLEATPPPPVCACIGCHGVTFTLTFWLSLI
jgi:hypothetical protein